MPVSLSPVPSILREFSWFPLSFVFLTRMTWCLHSIRSRRFTSISHLHQRRTRADRGGKRIQIANGICVLEIGLRVLLLVFSYSLLNVKRVKLPKQWFQSQTYADVLEFRAIRTREEWRAECFSSFQWSNSYNHSLQIIHLIVSFLGIIILLEWSAAWSNYDDSGTGEEEVEEEA